MLEKTRKPLLSQLEKYFLKKLDFFRKMSHVSESAENPKRSSMLAKRFVSSKRSGGLDKKFIKVA